MPLSDEEGDWVYEARLYLGGDVHEMTAETGTRRIKAKHLDWSQPKLCVRINGGQQAVRDETAQIRNVRVNGVALKGRPLAVLSAQLILMKEISHLYDDYLTKRRKQARAVTSDSVDEDGDDATTKRKSRGRRSRGVPRKPKRHRDL